MSTEITQLQRGTTARGDEPHWSNLLHSLLFTSFTLSPFPFPPFRIWSERIIRKSVGGSWKRLSSFAGNGWEVTANICFGPKCIWKQTSDKVDTIQLPNCIRLKNLPQCQNGAWKQLHQPSPPPKNCLTVGQFSIEDPTIWGQSLDPVGTVCAPWKIKQFC